jgi:hypothetical protein
MPQFCVEPLLVPVSVAGTRAVISNSWMSSWPAREIFWIGLLLLDRQRHEAQRRDAEESGGAPDPQTSAVH